MTEDRGQDEVYGPERAQRLVALLRALAERIRELDRANGLLEAAPELHQLVEELATYARLPKPRVAIIDTPSPNAFATGRDANHAVVAVTTGILGVLSRDELAGVVKRNPLAKVAIGETSARGSDRPTGARPIHSPGRFAELVAKANPHLKFDAWAHHPYPSNPNNKPTQVVKATREAPKEKEDASDAGAYIRNQARHRTSVDD